MVTAGDRREVAGEEDVTETGIGRVAPSSVRAAQVSESLRVLAVLLKQLVESIKTEYYNLWPISCFPLTQLRCQVLVIFCANNRERA